MASLKASIKDWERAFTSREGRQPTSKDVEQDPAVAKLYKEYQASKAAATAPAPAPAKTAPAKAASSLSMLVSRKAALSPLDELAQLAKKPLFVPSSTVMVPSAPFLASAAAAAATAALPEKDEWERPNAYAAKRISSSARVLLAPSTFAVPQALNFEYEPALSNKTDENDSPTPAPRRKYAAKKSKEGASSADKDKNKDATPAKAGKDENSWGSALRAKKDKAATSAAGKPKRAKRTGAKTTRKASAISDVPLRPGQKIATADTSRQVSDNFKRFHLTSKQNKSTFSSGAGGRFDRFKKSNYGKKIEQGPSTSMVGTSEINGDEVPFAIWSGGVDRVDVPAEFTTGIASKPPSSPPSDIGKGPTYVEAEEMDVDGIDFDDAQQGENRELVVLLKKLYGFTSFRPGQQKAIEAILAGKSTLLVLGTGTGKSLCYQLPAYKLAMEKKAFTIVVSPLISLMMDQLRNLPKGLVGAIIHSNMDNTAIDKVLDNVNDGNVHVLFVSPEKICSGFFGRRLRTISQPLGFVCVDEVHCASEWSHNFRPSYLRLGDTLRSIFDRPVVLGLSATLTAGSQADVVRVFQFSEIERGALLRKNLLWRVEKTEPGQDKVTWLVNHLKAHFAPTDSVIVYCTKQNQTDEVAMALRSRQFNAASYHAGKPNEDREAVQQQFTRNEIPIVVATVAFGLGLDKPDVRGVIHLNLPKSIENFVQETGRAGRDGKPAKCLALVDKSDYEKLRSLCFSCSVHTKSLEGLLDMLFEDEATKNKPMTPIRLDLAAIALDLRRETLETLLSHLEQHPSKVIETAPATYINATVTFTCNADAVAENDQLIQDILTLGRNVPTRRKGGYNVKQVVVSLCDLLQDGELLRDVNMRLWGKQKEKKIKYELADLAVPVTVNHAKYVRNDLLVYLQDLVHKLEVSSTHKVDQALAMLNEAAALSSAFADTEQQTFLETRIEQYFALETVQQAPLSQNLMLATASKSKLVTMSADVRLFVQRHREQLDTSLSVARILHGLSSPRYPSIDWFRNAYWGRYVDTPLETLRRIAARALGEEATAQAAATKRPVFSSDEDSDPDLSPKKKPATATQAATSTVTKDEFDFDG